MSRNRPAVGPSVDIATLRRPSTRSQAPQKGEDEPKLSQSGGSNGRPSRASKTKAQKQAVWQGAAPTGPKPKDASSVAQKRKRSVSKAQDLEPAKLKARKKESSVTEGEKMDVDSGKTKHVKKKAPLPTELFDDDNAESDRDEQIQDHGEQEEDFADDNDDDLRSFQDAGDSRGLQKVLDDERPRWTHDDQATDDNNDGVIGGDYQRPPSRASMSSGHLSVPASDASDSDSDSDGPTRAGLSSLKAAQKLVPEKSVRKSSSVGATRAVSSSVPERSKRDIARDQERPTWNAPPQSLKEPKIESTTKGPSRHVKVEDVTHPLPRHSRPAMKQEVRDDFVPRSSSPDVINVDDSDDDVVVVDPLDITVVVRSDGKVNLKQQHPRVEKAMQLALDYFLGYYLFKMSFPSTELKNNFALDACVNAAYTLKFDDMLQRFLTDAKYCDSLAPVLHGRVSGFRLKAKTASDMTVVTNYGLQNNIEERVSFLIDGMRYIHQLVPGPIDPKTGKPGLDVIKKDTAYMSQGLRSTLTNAFFKGSPSLAQKYSTLFVTGPDGRKELPDAMIALGSTAVHSSLNEYRTGYHVQSKFEGNHLQEIYDAHIFLLESLRKAKVPVQADLYAVLTEGSRLGDVSARPIAMEALALLGL